MFSFTVIYFDQILSGASASKLTQPFSIILPLDELCSFFISISSADLFIDDSTDLFEDDSFNFASCILSTLSTGVLIFCRELWIECLLLNGDSSWIYVFEPLALRTFMESSLDPGLIRISGMIYEYKKFSLRQGSLSNFILLENSSRNSLISFSQITNSINPLDFLCPYTIM